MQANKALHLADPHGGEMEDGICNSYAEDYFLLSSTAVGVLAHFSVAALVALLLQQSFVHPIFAVCGPGHMPHMSWPN